MRRADVRTPATARSYRGSPSQRSRRDTETKVPYASQPTSSSGSRPAIATRPGTSRTPQTSKSAVTVPRRRRCAALHPDKTRVVYCRDGKRRGSHEHTSFTFLGFTFRARGARRKAALMVWPPGGGRLLMGPGVRVCSRRVWSARGPALPWRVPPRGGRVAARQGIAAASGGIWRRRSPRCRGSRAGTACADRARYWPARKELCQRPAADRGRCPNWWIPETPDWVAGPARAARRPFCRCNSGREIGYCETPDAGLGWGAAIHAASLASPDIVTDAA
jgi:hypothetical protein